MLQKNKLIIVIAGPTASGKSALAIQQAIKYGGEIICADSRTVYKQMDIGTAKPSNEDQKQVKHYGLDLVEPDQIYTVGEFKRYAERAISEIHSKGKIPFIVGGSGLYIDAVVYDFDLSSPDGARRSKYAAMNLEQLQMEVKARSLKVSAQTMKNKRHLSRLLERRGTPSERGQLNPNVCYMVLNPDQSDLHHRIELRAKKMIENGLFQEIKAITNKYGTDITSLQTPGYKPFLECLEAKISQNEALQKFIQNDKKLAKRQITWFKRNPEAKWVNSSKKAEQQIKEFLQKFATI